MDLTAAQAATSTLHGPSGVFTLILLEIALGSLGIVAVAPLWNVVKRGFFLLTAATVVSCALLAWLAAGDLAPAALPVFAAVSAVSLVLLILKRIALARVAALAGTAAGLWAVVEVASLREGSGAEVKGAIAIVAGAIFLGASWEGMLLGHWYLVDRKLTARPMQLADWAFIGGTAIGLLSAALTQGGKVSANEAHLNPLLLVSGLTTWLAFGLVAVCALLAFFVHKLVKEGSIRAATGMLYLAVIMAFSAEFAAKARFFSV